MMGAFLTNNKNTMKRAFFLGGAILVVMIVGWKAAGRPEVAERPRSGAIPWMTVDEAGEKLKEVKKPVIIDLYTSWCGWCKQMDKKTYSNKQVAAYLQDKFYTVKMDAETHSTVNWMGKAYAFSPKYRVNEFAMYLTRGQLEFPTTIIIPPGEEPQAVPGYLEPKDLELLVKYFGEGVYRSKSFDVYQKSFKGSW
jgi:thioredoxin-related protein